MSGPTGLVLAAGGITAANELLFAPAAGGKAAFNWRIVPATLLLAAALDGLAQLAPGFATGLAGLALVAVLLVPVGSAPTPIENASKALGYT